MEDVAQPFTVLSQRPYKGFCSVIPPKPAQGAVFAEGLVESNVQKVLNSNPKKPYIYYIK